MAETTVAPNYNDVLMQALLTRKEWLERVEMTRLKEELRFFQVSYSVLYNMFLKKRLINEDPYKQDTKISDIVVPETGQLNEAKRLEQISLRLANYDNQLDFLVNFFQFAIDYMTIDRIRKIVELVRYIDWVSLTPDSKSVNTKCVAELVSNAKKGSDAITMSIIGEALTKLPKSIAVIMGILRDITVYHKEAYKLNVRGAIAEMQPSSINPVNIKKKMASALPGTPFYLDFIEELIKEDYTKDGPALKDAILKALKVAEEKPKTAKPKTLYKDVLMSGLQSIGSSSQVLGEIITKVDENQNILENRKKSFWEKIKEIFRAMTSSTPDEIVYELQFIDQVKGVETWEHLNFRQFRADLDKKLRIYSRMNGQTPQMAKIKTMEEEQILGYLERAIKDLQNLHRILAALDEYFKSSVPREEREKIKGIKPELSSIKNCFVKANQIRHDYSAQKEEEEQMKKLGINPDVQ